MGRLIRWLITLGLLVEVYLHSHWSVAVCLLALAVNEEGKALIRRADSSLYVQLSCWAAIRELAEKRALS